MALGLPACQTAQRVPIAEQTAGFNPGTLVPGDIVQVNYVGAPEWDRKLKVRADGKVNLREVGDVQAAGKDVGQLQAELSERYKGSLTNSEVLVTLDTSALPVYVSGAVNKPGKIILDRPLTVLEAIMEAGGFASEAANPSRVKIIRQSNGQHFTQVVDLAPTLKGQRTPAVYVRGYDVIYVSGDWL